MAPKRKAKAPAPPAVIALAPAVPVAAVIPKAKARGKAAALALPPVPVPVLPAAKVRAKAKARVARPKVPAGGAAAGGGLAALLGGLPGGAGCPGGGAVAGLLGIGGGAPAPVRGGRGVGLAPLPPPPAPMGFGFPPPPPVGGLPGGGPCMAMGGMSALLDEQWVDCAVAPGLLHSPDLCKGRVIQTVTVNAGGQVDGSALFVMQTDYPADAAGKFLEVHYGGCSSPAYSALLGQAFPCGNRSGQNAGILHLCTSPLGTCTASAGGRQVLHITAFRLRNLKQVSDPWACDLRALGAMEKEDTLPVPAGPPLFSGHQGLAESIFGADPGGRPRHRRRHHGSSSSGSSDEKKVDKLRRRLLEKRALSSTLAPSERVRYQMELEELKSGRGKKKHRKQRSRSRVRSRSRKRRRRRKDRSSSSDRSRDSSGSDFRQPSSRSGARSALVEQHRRNPGSLYDSALERMAEHLGSRGGGKDSDTSKMWETYLQIVVLGTVKGDEIPVEQLQELRTLCVALNQGGRGQIKMLLDVLSQRFLAIEARLLGNKSLARGLELVSHERAGLASSLQLKSAGRVLEGEARLLRAGEKLRGAP